MSGGDEHAEMLRPGLADRRKGRGNGPMRKRERWEVAVLVLVAAALYFPFVNQALNVDSDMLVHTARQILEDPLRPPLGEYGRLMALHDHTRMPADGVYYRCGHPPLLAYLLAPVIAVAGAREWPLHVVMFIPYLFAIFGVRRLLGLFFEGEGRFWGSLVWAAGPVLVVNSHTVMWDVTVTALMIWALVLFLEGLRTDRLGTFVLAGFVTGLAGLTKTNSIAVYVLIGGYLLLSARWKMLAAWAVPAVMLPMIWVAHNLLIFGQIQYLSVGWLNLSLGNVRYRGERALAYLGGTIMVPVFWYWLAAVGSRNRRFAALVPVPLAVWAVLLSAVLGKPLWFSGAYFLAAGAGLWVLISVCLGGMLDAGSGPRGRERLVLAAYALLYCGVMVMLPSANARYILPLVPLALVAVTAATEEMGERSRRWFRRLSLACGVLLALGLSIGDYLLCDADRRLPGVLMQRGYEPSRTWYFGRLSFAYYLHHAGFRNIRGDGGTLRDRDIVVHEEIPAGYPVDTYLRDEGWLLTPLDTLEFYRFPLRTAGGYAGWYGESRIPYSVAADLPVRRYVVFRATLREGG